MKLRKTHYGFSLIELLTAIAIMALLGALVVPLLGDTKALRIDVARRLLVSDLEHAQILAITHPEDQIGVVINDEGDGWHIASLDDPSVPLEDSMTGNPLVLRLGSGPATSASSVFVETNALSNTIAFDQNGGLVDFTQVTEIFISSGVESVLIQISPTTGSIQ